MNINNKNNNKGFTPPPSFKEKKNFLFGFCNILDYKNKRNLVGGFTLIELMVATSIFVVVMLASMSSLFVLLNAAKSSRALRFAMDNVNFSMESMARSIRMGTNYYCVDAGDPVVLDETSLSKDCSNGSTLVSFVPQPGNDGVPSSSRVAFMLGAEEDGVRSLNRCYVNKSGEDECISIVSPDVNIETLKFFVNGSESSDSRQPSVYIIIKGTVMVKDVPTSFAIQTMASQRNF